MKRFFWAAALWLGWLPFAENARAWELFRSENSDVRRGSELLEKGQPEEATQAFEAAARSLPNDPGVHLNRGLGLLASGKLPEAREAFRLATQGQGSPELRGKAHYNMGLAFTREADGASAADKLEEAQKYLREAEDAFKNSLRSAPKNRDAAWNLELVRRRIVELEKKRQEQKQNQDQQNKDQQNKDQQNQDQQDSQDQGQQEPKQPNGDPQDQPKSDDQASKDGAEKRDEQPADGSSAGDGDQADKQQDDAKSAAGQKPKADDKPAEQQDARPAQADPSASDKAPEALPEHMQRTLDALSESDESLQKHRARARAQQRPRRVEKDW